MESLPYELYDLLIEYIRKPQATLYLSHDWYRRTIIHKLYVGIVFNNAAEYNHSNIMISILNDTSVCKSLLSYNHALIITTENGHIDIAKILVDVGADPSEYNGCVLDLAISYGHVDLVKYYSQYCKDIDNEYTFALAVQKNNTEIIKYIGDTYNCQCYFGENLSMIIDYGNLEIVKYFLEHDLESTNLNIMTHIKSALWAAIYKNNKDIVECLLCRFKWLITDDFLKSVLYNAGMCDNSKIV